MKQRLLAASTKTALYGALILAGFTQSLRGMDVPQERAPQEQKERFTLKVVNKTANSYKLGVYDCAAGWTSSLSLGMIGHQYCQNIANQSLVVGPGRTVEKKGLRAAQKSPETVFAIWPMPEIVYPGSEKVDPEIEWELLRKTRYIKTEIRGDVVILTIEPTQLGREQPRLTMDQFQAEPRFALKIVNNTDDPYYAQVLAAVTTPKKGWHGLAVGGFTTKYEPISTVYSLEPQGTAETGALPRQSPTQGSEPDLIFAIALDPEDFQDSQTFRQTTMSTESFITQPNVVMSIEKSEPSVPGGKIRYARGRSMDTPEGRMKNAYIKITELSREEAFQGAALQRAALRQPSQSIYPMALLRGGEAQQLPSAPAAEPQPSASPLPSAPPQEPGEEEK